MNRRAGARLASMEESRGDIDRTREGTRGVRDRADKSSAAPDASGVTSTRGTLLALCTDKGGETTLMPRSERSTSRRYSLDVQ